jgi:hypothetical protein
MLGRRNIIGLSLICTLLPSAVAAHGASAAGLTIFECSKEATPKTFSDAHCDKEHIGGEYGHVVFPSTKASIAVTNGGTAEETKKATTAVLEVANLHGFANVVIECAEVSGIGEALNSAPGGIMRGSSEGAVEFHSGGGGNCTTNQAGCTVKVTVAGVKGQSIEVSPTEMGVKLEATGVSFNSVTFQGTCGLTAFGGMAVKGSTIATANGETNGHGATAWFIRGTMNSLIVGGSAAQLIGKVTFKRASTGNALVLTTD